MRFLICFAMLSAPLMADVNIRTNITDMAVAQDGQTSGAITFTLDNDDFGSASPETPIYLRITYSHAAKIAHTLVDYQSAKAGEVHVNQPIYLPLKLEGGLNEQLDVPTDAVSIVRHIRGESAYWIKIQRSSSTWIFNPETQTHSAPTPLMPVSFSIGVGARVSDEGTRPLFDKNLATLPGTRRDLDQQGEGYTLSTLNCVDLRESTLQPVPSPQEESILFFDPISFDHTTQGVTTSPTESGINVGADLVIPFSNDTRIGRGNPSEDTFMTPLFNPIVEQSLCDTHNGATDTPGLISMATRHSLRINHSLDTPAGTTLTFNMTETGAYGVRVALDPSGDPIPTRTVDGVVYVQLEGAGLQNADQLQATVDAPESSLFQLSGHTLAATVVATTGVTIDGSIEFDFYLEIFTSIANPTLQPLADIYARIAPDTHYDTAPFDGTADDGDPNTGITAEDQQFWCTGPEVLLSPFTLPLGRFTDDCAAERPVHADYHTILAELDGAFGADLTITRDHAITQHLIVQYMSTDGQQLTRTLVLDQPSLKFSLTDMAWFSPAGEPTPFPGMGGHLRVYNPDQAPFLARVELLTSNGSINLPFMPAQTLEASALYHRTPAFAFPDYDAILHVANPGKAAVVQVTATDNGVSYQAQTQTIPSNAVVAINLNNLNWPKGLRSINIGDTPTLLSLETGHNDMVTAISVTHNGFSRMAALLDADAFYKSEHAFGVIFPISDDGSHQVINLSKPSTDQAGSPTATVTIWENPGCRWIATVPLDQNLKSVAYDKRENIVALYDVDTGERYTFVPGEANTKAVFRAETPAEMIIESSTPVHAELVSSSGSFPRYQPALDLSNSFSTRVAYDPSNAFSQEIWVNSLQESHINHLLYFTEADGDIFKISLPFTDNISDRLNILHLNLNTITIFRESGPVAFTPEQVVGDGDFYDSPAVVEAVGGQHMTVLTFIPGLPEPTMTASGVINDPILGFESKPLPEDTQVTLKSNIPNIPFTLTQDILFDLPLEYIGTTGESGITTVDVTQIDIGQNLILNHRAFDTPDAFAFEQQQFNLGIIDVSAGADQMMTEGNATVTARVNGEVDGKAGGPDDTHWAWYSNNILVGDSNTLNTNQAGLYRIETRHTQQRFRGVDHVWVLNPQASGTYAPYLPQWSQTLGILELVHLANQAE